MGRKRLTDVQIAIRIEELAFAIDSIEEGTYEWLQAKVKLLKLIEEQRWRKAKDKLAREALSLLIDAVVNQRDNVKEISEFIIKEMVK